MKAWNCEDLFPQIHASYSYFDFPSRSFPMLWLANLEKYWVPYWLAEAAIPIIDFLWSWQISRPTNMVCISVTYNGKSSLQLSQPNLALTCFKILPITASLLTFFSIVFLSKNCEIHPQLSRYYLIFFLSFSLDISTKASLTAPPSFLPLGNNWCLIQWINLPPNCRSFRLNPSSKRSLSGGISTN